MNTEERNDILTRLLEIEKRISYYEECAKIARTAAIGIRSTLAGSMRESGIPAGEWQKFEGGEYCWQLNPQEERYIIIR